MRKRRPLFNLPNVLTLSRFVLAPIMLVLVMHMRDPAEYVHAWRTSLWVVIIMAVAMLTDLFDGAVARARGEVTIFGKIMDPVADSTFFMTLLFGLFACKRFGGAIDVWMPILVLYREVAIHILRRYAALKGHAVPAKLSGKIKMFSQSLVTAAFFVAVLIRDWSFANRPDGALIGEPSLLSFAYATGLFTVVVNILSLIEYSRDVPELLAEYVGPEPASGEKTDQADK